MGKKAADSFSGIKQWIFNGIYLLTKSEEKHNLVLSIYLFLHTIIFSSLNMMASLEGKLWDH